MYSADTPELNVDGDCGWAANGLSWRDIDSCGLPEAGVEVKGDDVCASVVSKLVHAVGDGRSRESSSSENVPLELSCLILSGTE